MVQSPRKYASSNIYHVVARGVCHCIIFEDDKDRGRFLDYLDEVLKNNRGTLLAWCLMDNHYHLLLKVDQARLSEAMKWLNSSYALYFNSTHERDGHLFQGRFKSEPVETDEYLLTVIRYIHQNPVKGGIVPTCDFRWSSYRSYLGRCTAEHRQITSPDCGLHLLGGKDAFIRFHEMQNPNCRCIDTEETRISEPDNEMLQRAQQALGIYLWNALSGSRAPNETKHCES